VRREAIVRFVDIGGIVSHHCLNFVFINLVKFEIYELGNGLEQDKNKLKKNLMHIL
jgi:hypothetical protein